MTDRDSAANQRDRSDLELLEWVVLSSDWYRRCLEDVVDRRRVVGLDEARAGYDHALDAATERLREVGRWTTT